MQRRFAVAQREIEHYALFDYIVVNEDVAARLRRAPLDRGRRARAAARAGSPRRVAFARRPPRLESARSSDMTRDAASLRSSAGAASTTSPGSRTSKKCASRPPSGRRATRSSADGSEDTTLLFLPRHGRGHRIAPARDRLPREHLRPEEARRDAPRQHQRRRFDEGGDRPGRLRRRRPVHRSDEGADVDVLRRRTRRARRLRRPGLRRPVGGARAAPPSAPAPGSTGAARTSASRVRSSRRAPRASSIARGACRSSG